MPWWQLTGLLLAVLAVLVWFVVELHRYFRGRSAIRGKQLLLRGVVAVLLMIVAAMMIYGAYYPWESKDALKQLGYWTIPLLLMCVVFLLIIRDWRMLIRERHLQRAELYRQMDRELGTPREPTPKRDQ
ncbi:MAG: hypothetical protein ACUVX8_04940 [Candidatus Zipacnadales bacterium]